MHKKIGYFWVGIFVILGFFSLLFLAYKVSGLGHYQLDKIYTVSANFNNIGGLKVRAPVRIAGVHVGVVHRIGLNHKTYQATVECHIDQRVALPSDTMAKILTEGLLGSNYVELVPGFSTALLANNGWIQNTQSAIILENLIGKFIYGKSTDKKKK